MGDRLFRPEEIAPEDLAIALHAIAVVPRDERFALGAIIGGQLVPGESWLRVMGNVQVVVEEKQSPEGRGLDDDVALTLVLGRLVLAEGAHQHEGDAGIGEKQYI